MGKRTSYEPGTFCWVDLQTGDQDGAKAFYSDLFGWEMDDNEIPDSETIYTMCKLGADNVAAISGLPPGMEGIPPHWNNYVSVASADESAERARVLGGEVMLPAFDVLGAGRMAALADPAGAAFNLWEPYDQIGATLVNDPNCLTFNELSTSNVPKAIEFYEALFGWNVAPLDAGDAPPYWGIRHDGAAAGRNGGMRALAPEQEGVPPHWMPYFNVESAADAAERTAELGGTVVMAPFAIPAGAQIAILGDPQGAHFAIFAGDADE